MALSNIIWKCQCLSLGTQGFYIFHFPTCAPIISIVHIILLTHKLGSMLSLSVCIPKTLEGFYPYHIFHFASFKKKKKKNVSHSFSGPSKTSFNNNKKSYVLNNYINNLQIIYSTKISSMIVLTNSSSMNKFYSWWILHSPWIKTVSA